MRRGRVRRRGWARAVAAFLPVAALILGGCAGLPPTRELRVSAAASLGAVFNALVTEFEAERPGLEVRLNVAGSSDLAAQIEEGAPVDVFASADEATMSRLDRAGLVSGQARLFASNTLEIATAPGNPEGIAGFDDLDRDDLRVVICAPQAPCGAATARLEQATGVRLDPISEQSAVTEVLGAVLAGEADAGLVYHTDIVGAGEAVAGVAIPEAAALPNRYPIAVMRESAAGDDASAFVDFVLGERGQAAFATAGFGPAVEP